MTEQLDLFETAYQESLEAKPLESDLQEKHDKENKQKKLTSRKWALYNLIKHNSLVEHRKTTQKEICNALKDYGYEWDDDELSHDHCVTIWNDIKDINLSHEVDKIIISKNFKYWIGDKKETNAFIDRLWSDLEPRLIRYWAYLKKVSRDGQGQLLDRKLNPIDENSKARTFIESYGQERIGE